MKLGIFYCCATVIAAEIYSVIKNLCKLSCIYVLVDPVGFELLARATHLSTMKAILTTARILQFYYSQLLRCNVLHEVT
jgi:multisubunit Na+/H+ antiporter MnhG subunit